MIKHFSQTSGTEMEPIKQRYLNFMAKKSQPDTFIKQENFLYFRPSIIRESMEIVTRSNEIGNNKPSFNISKVWLAWFEHFKFPFYFTSTVCKHFTHFSNIDCTACLFAT